MMINAMSVDRKRHIYFGEVLLIFGQYTKAHSLLRKNQSRWPLLMQALDVWLRETALELSGETNLSMEMFNYTKGCKSLILKKDNIKIHFENLEHQIILNTETNPQVFKLYQIFLKYISVRTDRKLTLVLNQMKILLSRFYQTNQIEQFAEILENLDKNTIELALYAQSKEPHHGAEIIKNLQHASLSTPEILKKIFLPLNNLLQKTDENLSSSLIIEEISSFLRILNSLHLLNSNILETIFNAKLNLSHLSTIINIIKKTHDCMDAEQMLSFLKKAPDVSYDILSNLEELLRTSAVNVDYLKRIFLSNEIKKTLCTQIDKVDVWAFKYCVKVLYKTLSQNKGVIFSCYDEILHAPATSKISKLLLYLCEVHELFLKLDAQEKISFYYLLDHPTKLKEVSWQDLWRVFENVTALTINPLNLNTIAQQNKLSAYVLEFRAAFLESKDAFNACFFVNLTVLQALRLELQVPSCDKKLIDSLYYAEEKAEVEGEFFETLVSYQKYYVYSFSVDVLKQLCSETLALIFSLKEDYAKPRDGCNGENKDLIIDGTKVALHHNIEQKIQKILLTLAELNAQHFLMQEKELLKLIFKLGHIEAISVLLEYYHLQQWGKKGAVAEKKTEFKIFLLSYFLSLPMEIFSACQTYPKHPVWLKNQIETAEKYFPQFQKNAMNTLLQVNLSAVLSQHGWFRERIKQDHELLFQQKKNLRPC